MAAPWRDLTHVLRTLMLLVNSGPEVSGEEQLGDTQAVRDFIEECTISEVADPGPDELAALHALRRQMRAILLAPPEKRTEMVNALLSRAPIMPRLVDHDDLGLHLHYFPPYAPLTEHLLTDLGMALAHVLSAGETDRLRICARPGCGRAMFDTTKNRSRIYCDSSTCGNRQHTAAYRARRTKSAAASQTS